MSSHLSVYQEGAAQYFYDQRVLDGKSGDHRGGKRKSDSRGDGPYEKKKPGKCMFFNVTHWMQFCLSIEKTRIF